jgi:hypothetical protein
VLTAINDRPDYDFETILVGISSFSCKNTLP